ncbi:MAG: hypothetical protein WC506_02395 [Candidatus Micrarchaeia archaeon]
MATTPVISNNTPYSPAQIRGAAARYLNVFNVAISGPVTITAMFERQTADIASNNTSIGRYCPAEEDMRAAIFASCVGTDRAGRDTVEARIIFRVGNEPQREIVLNVPKGTTIGELFQTRFGADVVQHPALGNYIRSLFGTGERHGGWGWQFYVDGGLPYVLEETILLPIVKNDYAVSSMLLKNSKFLELLNSGLLERRGNGAFPGLALPLAQTAKDSAQIPGRTAAEKEWLHVPAGSIAQLPEIICTENAVIDSGQEKCAEPRAMRHGKGTAGQGPLHENHLPDDSKTKTKNEEHGSPIVSKQTDGKTANTSTPSAINEESVQNTHVDAGLPVARAADSPEAFAATRAQVHFRPWEIGTAIEIVDGQGMPKAALQSQNSISRARFLKKLVLPFNKRRHAIMLAQESKKQASAGAEAPESQNIENSTVLGKLVAVLAGGNAKRRVVLRVLARDGKRYGKAPSKNKGTQAKRCKRG